MEFPDLGQNCSWSLCKTLDFLPFTCSYCCQVFCKDHFNQDSHKCEVYKKKQSNQNIKSYVCSIDNCNTCSITEMLCEKCSKHYCLVHRFHECFDTTDNIEEKKKLWNASKEQFAVSIKDVNSTINEKIKKAVQNPKKQTTALKIQLMRLKGKAKGNSDVPTVDRLYFLIHLPKNSPESSQAVFVSKDWSVGKVIDFTASICKVVNKNNETNSPKLRLFKAADGTQISTETSTKMAEVMDNNTLANGESLILEYVNPSEDMANFKLENFADYNE